MNVAKNLGTAKLFVGRTVAERVAACVLLALLIGFIYLTSEPLHEHPSQSAKRSEILSIIHNHFEQTKHLPTGMSDMSSAERSRLLLLGVKSFRPLETSHNQGKTVCPYLITRGTGTYTSKFSVEIR